LNKNHIITLIEFANTHDLCISVVGTGHDYMNRHMSVGCREGLMIRMSLMKGIELNLDKEEAVVGPGVIFSELL